PAAQRGSLPSMPSNTPTRGVRPDCCDREATAHAVALPSNPMNSRRLTRIPTYHVETSISEDPNRVIWGLLRREGDVGSDELPFANAVRHAWMISVSRPHHETLIRRQSNTSAIPPILAANKDRPRRLLCATERNRSRGSLRQRSHQQREAMGDRS